MAKGTRFEPVRVFQNVQDVGAKLMAESNLLNDEIQQRLAQLAQNWDELKDMTSNRGQKLDESLAFQQFAANVEEEEAWITEKTTSAVGRRSWRHTGSSAGSVEET